MAFIFNSKILVIDATGIYWSRSGTCPTQTEKREGTLASASFCVQGTSQTGTPHSGTSSSQKFTVSDAVDTTYQFTREANTSVRMISICL